jgi:hypothetical protein
VGGGSGLGQRRQRRPGHPVGFPLRLRLPANGVEYGLVGCVYPTGFVPCRGWSFRARSLKCSVSSAIPVVEGSGRADYDKPLNSVVAHGRDDVGGTGRKRINRSARERHAEHRQHRVCAIDDLAERRAVVDITLDDRELRIGDREVLWLSRNRNSRGASASASGSTASTGSLGNPRNTLPGPRC